jgi:hypothetical protein
MMITQTELKKLIRFDNKDEEIEARSFAEEIIGYHENHRRSA